MANIVYIAASIDGYIAKEDGGLDWLPEISESDNDYGFSELLERIDALVMGRNTFEKVLSFGQWPYPKKVFVLSNTLEKVPVELEGKVEIINGEIEDVVKNLNKKGYIELYIDGGQTIQEFLRKGLIDEITITRIPIILGGGIPLFGRLEAPIKLKNLKSQVVDEHIIMNTYSIDK